MKKKVLCGVTALLVVALIVPLVTACPKAAPPAKDKIVIGQSVSLSGPNAIQYDLFASKPWDIWVDEVNAKGGLYIEDYGKRLPLEVIRYDDKTEHGTMVKLLEKLILDDKVDFLFPPISTSFLFAAAPIANKYGYVLFGGAGGATTLEKFAADLPYFFAVLNYSNHNQVPAMGDLFVELGVETVAITFNEDLHGTEYATVAGGEFAARGINILMLKTHPLGISDMSPILKEAEASGADAFLGFGYPDEGFLSVGQSMALGYNPKVWEWNVGPCAALFRDIFGAEAVNGVMGFGAWSPKSSAGLQELYDKVVDIYGEGGVDGWGQGFFYGSLQFLEQAIEEAGTLDQAVIRDICATETFDTCLGPTWFDDLQRLAVECHPGQVGQWQNGVWEVIDVGVKRTAEPLYPKPAWPAPPPE